MARYLMSGKGIELSSVKEAVNEYSKGYRDMFTDDFYITDDMKMAVKGKEYNMSKTALNQVCQLSGVSPVYVNHCVNNDEKEFAALNLNYWLNKNKSDKLIVRTKNDAVRAVVSKRYDIYDTSEFVDNILEGLDFKSYEVVGSFCDDEAFNMRVVKKDFITDKDDLKIGFSFFNSEVGKGAVQMKIMLYKQICTNGMIVNKMSDTLFTQSHVGVSGEEISEKIYNTAKNLEAYSDRMLSVMTEKKANKTNPQQLNDYIAMQFSRAKIPTSEKFRAEIARLMLNVYELSEWGFAQAVTEACQKYSLENRMLMETFAGNLIFRK